MAAAQDRSRPINAHPRTARVTDIQPSHSPRSSKRRHTLAGCESHSVPNLFSKYKRPSARTEKNTHGRRNVRHEPTWADQFEEHLTDHKETIWSETDKSLDEVRAKHLDKVKELSRDFGAQLSILQESGQPLHPSIANEVLQIAVNHPDAPAGQGKNIEVELQYRVKTFKALASHKHRLIQDLINDWNDTQVQVIALAAEIIGPEMVTFSRNKKFKEYSDIDSVLGRSQISYDRAEDEFNDVLAEISDFEQQMGQLTAETKVTVHQILLAKSSKQREAMNRMKKLAKELQDGD